MHGGSGVVVSGYVPEHRVFFSGEIRCKGFALRSVGYLFFPQQGQDLCRCSMGAENDSCLFQLFRRQRQKLTGYKGVLGFSVSKGTTVKTPWICRAGPEGFFNAVSVFADQAGSRLKDRAAAAVIGGQIDSAGDFSALRQMKILQKSFHHEGVGAAESVDRLVVIPHYEEIAAGI